MEISVDGLSIDLKVGADPEIFVAKRGKLFSAHGLVPGTKDSPHKVNKGAIQVDGMALEFNIDPSESCEDFVDKIQSVMGQLEVRLPEGVQLTVIPTAEFGHQYIQSQPEEAKELGCSADLNAYTGGENPKPDAEVPFRTAAGHVHIGWTEMMDINSPEHMEVCCELTKVLDLYLGVPSVLLDSDTKRRSLYGAAGAFRSKTYGLEYRVLSNFWLKTPELMRWVYDQTSKAVRAYLGGFRVTDNQAVDIINSSSVKGARKLIATNPELGVPNA